MPVNEKRKDLDTVLDDIGQFGRYQKLVVFFVLLPAIIPSGFHSYSQVFIAAVPDDYWCSIPELKNLSKTLRHAAVPRRENGEYEQCIQYDPPDWKPYVSILQNGTFRPPDNLSKTACSNGWEYDAGAITTSIVMQWDLVCEKQFSPTLALILLSVGELVFAPILGYASDRYGRKKPYFVCLILQLIFGAATAFAPNFIVFCIFRFVVGGTYGPMNLVVYYLAMEVVGVEYRSTTAVLSSLAFAVGTIMLGGVAWLVTDWVPFTLWTSLPFAAYVAYWFVMPESPRWLLAEGRIDEVVGVMKTISEVNRRPQDEQYFLDLRRDLEEHVEMEKSQQRLHQHSYFDLFRTPNLRRNILIMTMLNAVNLSVYTGLSYFGPTLSDENPHLSFFLISIVEMPANLVFYLTAERIGRKIPMITCLVASGILCIVAVAVPEEQYWPLLIICLLAKLCITVTYGFAELVEGELFPTVIRNEAGAFTELVSSALSTATPVIVYTGYHSLSLPLVIFGCMAIVAGFATLWIPETWNKKLPETIKDGEALGEVNPLANCFRPHRRKWKVESTLPLSSTS